jgi:saccharopine dehydrogenase (NADP+, L-glutamate forming)
MLLNGEIALKGVTLPIQPEVYNPILDELETFDIRFVEKELQLDCRI